MEQDPIHGTYAGIRWTACDEGEVRSSCRERQGPEPVYNTVCDERGVSYAYIWVSRWRCVVALSIAGQIDIDFFILGAQDVQHHRK